MKLLGSKLAVPAISAVAVLTLVGVQAMALSQSSDPAPSSELTTPVDTPSDPNLAADPNPSDSATPIDIPESHTTLPSGDDDEEQFEEGDGDRHSEDYADDSEDDSANSYEDEDEFESEDD